MKHGIDSQGSQARLDVLVIDVLSLFMDLVLQGEVESEVFHLLPVEKLHLRLILLILQVLDHVRKPHRQSVVTAKKKKNAVMVTGLYSLWASAPHCGSAGNCTV